MFPISRNRQRSRVLRADCSLSLCLVGVPFPKNFLSIAKTILKRLFRVYAHIYHQHFTEVVQLGEEAHLNTSFKHFIFFVQVQIDVHFLYISQSGISLERSEDVACGINSYSANVADEQSEFIPVTVKHVVSISNKSIHWSIQNGRLWKVNKILITPIFVAFSTFREE